MIKKMMMNPRMVLTSLWLALCALGVSSAAGSEGVPPSKKVVVAGQIESCRLSQGVSVSMRRLLEGGEPHDAPLQAPLDAQGHFRVELPGPGVYRVSVTEPGGEALIAVVAASRLTVLPPVSAPACIPQVQYPWTIPKDLPPARPPDVRITGRVFELNGERTPVAGAWVWASSPFSRVARTAADGTYRLDYPRTGKFRLFVHAPGYEEIAIPTRTDTGGGAITGPTFPLSPVSYLHGRVVDHAGEPRLARIDIEPVPREAPAESNAPTQRPRTAYTDRTGHFDVAVAPDTRYRLTVISDGAVEARLSVSTPSAGEPAPPIRIELATAASVSGLVVGPDAAPEHPSRLRTTRPAGGSVPRLRQAPRVCRQRRRGPGRWPGPGADPGARTDT